LIVEFLIALVGLGVAVDYSLLIVSRWREERAHGHDGDEAVRRAMQTAGRAVVFSGTTVAIGLLALIALPVPFLRSVGYGGLVIPLVSVGVATTLLPVLLAKLGSRLDWPHLRSDDRASRAWTRWAGFVVRHRAAAAAAAVAVLAALVVSATSLQFGAAAGNPDVISVRGDARAGLIALERSGIGAGVLSPNEILTGERSALLLARRLQGLDGVQGAVAPAGAAWHRGSVALVDVLDHTDSSTTTKRLRSAAHALGSEAQVGGIVAQNSDFISAVYGSFPLMIALVALLTFIVLARAFRSLLLPFKAVLLNVVSVAAAWGVLVLVWQKGYGSNALWGLPGTGSIPSWLPVIVFAFLFGLSMDYEVFILARMREEYDQSGSTGTAVVQGIGRTGRLVTSAALILFLAFVAMATAPSSQVKMIATGLGAGILLDATVIRGLLVPAAVALFGRWNWYLPARAARLLRVPPAVKVEPAADAAKSVKAAAA
jgi:RND superfamily putative drug exporter